MMRRRRFSLVDWLLAGCVVTGAAIGLLLMTGDPLYWVQERLPGANHRTHDGLILAAAEKHGVAAELLKALVWQESRFRPDATGKAGERGLMQVTEAAAADWAAANRLETFVPTDLFDPKTNLDAGTWYLARALRRHAGRDDPRPFALAEYNAGASRVDRWLAGTTDAENPVAAAEFQARIDFPTTAHYIESILAREKFYRRRGEFPAPR